jgi:protein-tyrosine phosphatase
VIDIHHHCLFGVDEGPADIESAVAQCRAALADGIETIVATPHVLREEWANDDPAELDRRLLKLNTALGGRPRIVPGREYWFGAGALELATLGCAGPLVAINRLRYLLLEFNPLHVAPDARSVLYEITLAGFTPVIAHPERNRVFQEDPGRLEELVRVGCLSQITAMSLTGDFGPKAQAACHDFFRWGLVHLVATDAHSIVSRPPILSRAREVARREWGSDAERGLFVVNPDCVVRGLETPYTPEPRRSSRGLWTRLAEAF